MGGLNLWGFLPLNSYRDSLIAESALGSSSSYRASKSYTHSPTLSGLSLNGGLVVVEGFSLKYGNP